MSTEWTTRTVSELLDSVNTTEDPIDVILSNHLGSLKRVVESVMEAERDEFCGIACNCRGVSRTDYRNGYYTRDFETCFGVLHKLRVPRTRSGRFRTQLIEKFERRQRKLSEVIRSLFLCGVSQRDVSEVLRPFLGIEPSASTVCRIAKSLDEEVKRFLKRPLRDEFKYLLLDGVALKVKISPRAVGRCALVGLGIREDGSKELLGFRVEHSESETCWQRMLDDLYRRGIVGDKLQMVISDGGAGLIKALNYVYPDVAHQRCWTHKIRNVASRLKRPLRKPCLKGLESIWRSTSRFEAERAFRVWEREWITVAPDVVACVEQDLEDLLVFLDQPKQDWSVIRTTNHLERCFREFRRRLRPMGCMKSKASCERMIYAVCKRLNLRWQKKRTSNKSVFTQAA